jgi:biopolymer transport protein ExbB/TolQ
LIVQKIERLAMRFRTLVLVLAIVLVAAFVALNVDEFMRVSVLSLGFTTIQVSLGLVMLVLLVVATLIFLGNTLYMQSSNLLETRRYARELNTQRELADKAEASRFTELRSYLEVQALAAQQRETVTSTALSERFAAQQKALLARIEQTDNSLAAYMGQLEDRLERRTPSPSNGSGGSPMLGRERDNFNAPVV